MSAYFPGIRIAGPFQAKLGRHTIDYQYAERWLNKDCSHTVRCGQSSKLVLTVTVGISRSESESFKDFVEGSFGPSALASLKTHMETNLQSEFTITESKTETNEFNCPAPTCGRQTHTLYQLVRDYDFLFTRSRRLLGPITRSAGLRQHTKQFDLRQETDENDPQCPCKSKDRRSSRGVLGIKFGDLSLRMDAKMLRHPVPCANVSFGNQNILLRMTEDTYSSNIEAGELPEFVRYLSGITSGNVVISGYPISDEYGALGIYTSEPVQEDLGMPLPDLGSLQEIARERL